MTAPSRNIDETVADSRIPTCACTCACACACTCALLYRLGASSAWIAPRRPRAPALALGRALAARSSTAARSSSRTPGPASLRARGARVDRRVFFTLFINITLTQTLTPTLTLTLTLTLTGGRRRGVYVPDVPQERLARVERASNISLVVGSFPAAFEGGSPQAVELR